MSVEHQAMVITGTSRGLGRDLAEIYLDRGWEVFGCARGPSDLRHERYQHFRLDIGNEKDVLRMFAAVRKSTAPLTAMINNAGVAAMNHALTTPMSTVEWLLRVNVIGAVLCCREAGKLMALRGYGRIINFGSVAVPYALEGEAAYVTSKAAIQAFTRTLAKELGDQGVTVNAVAPNPIKTDLIAGVPEVKMTALIDRQAIKRYGTVEDVLAVIDFFLNPRSAMVTGQTIYLGGP
jgi:3-oxoacyl-[acyl-carrier protein] reductase